MPTSAHSCVPRCIYTVHTRLLSGDCKSGTRLSLRSRIFLPSGSGIFQTGSSSFPFPVAPMPTSAYLCVPRCVYTVNTRLLSRLHIRNRLFAQIRNFSFVGCGSENFPNRIQFLTFSGRFYANFCLLMCAKVRTSRIMSCLRIRNWIFAQIRNFWPSRPGIFQTGSSSFPFLVASMPASAYSCMPRCVYTVNRRLLSGLHIRNRIFAQIRNFFAIRTRNFPNRIQFVTFSGGRSYASFCLLMCAKVRIPDSFCQGCTSGSRFSLRSGIFSPSGPGIFQTGSSSLFFLVAPMPTSAYSCAKVRIYRIFAQI
jgi:hypothetical protein